MKRWQVRFMKVFFSILLSAMYILSPLNTNLKITHASSSGVAFAGFNLELYSQTPSDLSTIDALLSNGIITFNSDHGSAIQYIDLQSIGASIDLGHLSIDYATLALIASEAGFSEDEASFHLIFTTEESLENPLKTFSIDRSALVPGSFEPLSGTVMIPEGTRFVFVEFTSTANGTIRSSSNLPV